MELKILNEKHYSVLPKKPHRFSMQNMVKETEQTTKPI